MTHSAKWFFQNEFTRSKNMLRFLLFVLGLVVACIATIVTTDFTARDSRSLCLSSFKVSSFHIEMTKHCKWATYALPVARVGFIGKSECSLHFASGSKHSHFCKRAAIAAFLPACTTFRVHSQVGSNSCFTRRPYPFDQQCNFLSIVCWTMGLFVLILSR